MEKINPAPKINYSINNIQETNHQKKNEINKPDELEGTWHLSIQDILKAHEHY